MRVPVLLLGLTLTVSACSLSVSGDPPPELSGTFEAALTGEVEGTLAGTAGALQTPGGAGVSIQLLPIGTTSRGLSFTGPLATEGPFTVGDFDEDGAAATYRDGQRFLFGTSGTLTILYADDQVIDGTFEVEFATRPNGSEPTVLRAEGTFSAVRF